MSECVTTWGNHQEQLKRELQSQEEKKFERLAAALISRLLDVPIAVASSGSQYGADAGPAGRQGRRFRLECKRYGDTSHLRGRELLGEIDQAIDKDEALEAWFLVASCEVPEQTQQALIQHGEKNGVPIVIVDWGQDHEVTSLAALCALAPDVVERYCSDAAGENARALQDVSADTTRRLRRELQSWCLGFEEIRTQSFKKLDRIWSFRDISYAELGQNAAGGAQTKKVRRVAVHEELNTWWQRLDRDTDPAAVIGDAGVGKTWAALDWLIDNKDEKPIVLLMRSSAATALTNVATETGIKELLARRLYEMTGVRDPEHWFRRLDYLLGRPIDEGPVLIVYFDGLNQEPSVQWRRVLQILRGDAFAKRVRVILSTRNHHFEERLQHSAKPVRVYPFDRGPGGELDQMLRFEGLSQDDLHKDIIERACIPRLFSIVVSLRERLGGSGQITIHRILWEYGRRTLGEQDERSFSEQDWKGWLRKIAKDNRDSIRKYSFEELSRTVSRPDLDTNEVRARLSDVVDGKFVQRDKSDDFTLDPVVVSHALGVALLAHFHSETTLTFETLKERLLEWIDPIAGVDERAEVLRAAVSILIAQGRAEEVAISGVLVTAWLQSQNFPEEHFNEIASFAPMFPNALLDAIEHSGGNYHDSARLRAVNALREIPRDDFTTLSSIVVRSTHWMKAVPHDIASSQTLRVIGVELYPAGQSSELLKSVVPSLIDGFPLTKSLPIFEAEAITAILVGRPSECWEALRWLCLFNKIDPDEMTIALRELAEKIRCRPREPDVSSDLPKRVAARLLRLTGKEEDEDTAGCITVDVDRPFIYERDYLPQPGRSFFELERRHADRALCEPGLSVVRRLQRTKDLWVDPKFKPSDSFVEELREVAANIDVGKLDRQQVMSSEDFILRELTPALARTLPEVLADLIGRKIRGKATCQRESRYWSAITATDDLILAGEDEVDALHALRLSGQESCEKEESYVANKLLLLEVGDMDAPAQFETLIRADLEFILRDFSNVLRPLARDGIDALINQFDLGTLKQQIDLLSLLSCHPLDLSDYAWSWIERHAKQTNNDCQSLAFQILTWSDAARFGQFLDADGWSWNQKNDFRINHFGTDALVEATLDLPFAEVAPRLAPWRLLKAIRQRGATPAEVRLASEIFGRWLVDETNEEETPEAAVTIEDFEFVLQHASDIVAQWLEGFAEPTVEFLRRAHRVAFMPLCEALLIHDPSKGVRLWRVLHNVLPFRRIGSADVEELWHMVFRVPDSPEILTLQEELADLEYCNTDQALLNLAVAASFNGKSEWLTRRIEADQESSDVWRRQRAAVLKGFTTNNTLPVEGAWPDGEIRTNYADSAKTSARHQWAEACARRWWKAFLEAPNPTEAYAAWVLFLRSADRRAFVWMQQEIKAAEKSDDFFRLKMTHFHLNQEKVKNALKKREDRMDRNFLYSRVVKGVGPWAK